MQPVFSGGDGAFLGARETMLASGDAVFPVLSTRPKVMRKRDDSTNDELSRRASRARKAGERASRRP